MERITYFSPITFSKIPIGGVSQTPKGFWLAKIRTGLGTYQNIKDGVGQLTREQAVSCLVRTYYERVGEKKGWTQQEIEKKLQKAYQLELDDQYKNLTAKAQQLVELENQSRGDLLKVEMLGIFHEYFQIYELKNLDNGSVTYKVKILKKEKWRRIRDFVSSLNLGQKNQRCWQFDSFGAATSFISFVCRKQLEQRT